MTKRTTKSELWGPCVNLGLKVNGSAIDSGPWVSPDGLELYFDSWRSDGYGKGDLWVTTREAATDYWADPLNLGAAVNSPDYEGSPSISVDGRMLFFHSDRQGGHGQVDIWMTRRASVSDPWELPMNLGSQVNGVTDEAYPRLAPDGRTIYFWSARNENFQVPIIPICDFNDDGIVDAADMCIMIDHWHTDYPLCDIGPMPWGDGVVDVQDLIVLAEHLFEEFPPAEPVE